MKNPQMLSASRRHLTENERRLLRAKSRSLTRRGRRASVVAFPVTGGGVLLLWLWTIVASDVNWVVVTMFWVIMGAGIALWVRRDMRTHARNFETMSGGLDSALRRNAVDVCDVRARRFAELEEI